MLNADKTQCIFVGTRGFVSQNLSDTSVHVGDTTIIPSTPIKEYLLILWQLYACNLTHTHTHSLNLLKKKYFTTVMSVNRIKVRVQE